MNEPTLLQRYEEIREKQDRLAPLVLQNGRIDLLSQNTQSTYSLFSEHYDIYVQLKQLTSDAKKEKGFLVENLTRAVMNNVLDSMGVPSVK